MDDTLWLFKISLLQKRPIIPIHSSVSFAKETYHFEEHILQDVCRALIYTMCDSYTQFVSRICTYARHVWAPIYTVRDSCAEFVRRIYTYARHV